MTFKIGTIAFVVQEAAENILTLSVAAELSAVFLYVETNLFYLLEYPTLEELNQRQINEVYYFVTGADEEATLDLIDESDVMIAYGTIVK